MKSTVARARHESASPCFAAFRENPHPQPARARRLTAPHESPHRDKGVELVRTRSSSPPHEGPHGEREGARFGSMRSSSAPHGRPHRDGTGAELARTRHAAAPDESPYPSRDREAAEFVRSRTFVTRPRSAS